MVQDNINIIIQNAVNANKNNNITEENKLINSFYQAFKENFSLFESTVKIDLNNKNGFNLDKDVMEKIFNRYLNSTVLINDTKDSAITKENLLASKVYTKVGIVHVIFDGNTYTMLELILLGLLTHNTIIFTDNGYMHGTNGLLLSLIQTILEKESYQKEMFQHCFSIKPEDFFDNFKTINMTIVIGNADFHNKYRRLCSNNMLISGHNNYDIYVDDLAHIETIEKIINQGLNVNIYINSELTIETDNAIFVSDVDEAIALINASGAGFSSSIFTDDNENASKFIKNINSKNVLVNVSPTIERQLDIRQEDLLQEKNIILSNIYKFDGTIINVEF